MLAVRWHGRGDVRVQDIPPPPPPGPGELLVDDPRIALVSATGSTVMGRAVGPRVAQRFGRVLLELGGNNAMIVCPSADLALAERDARSGWAEVARVKVDKAGSFQAALAVSPGSYRARVAASLEKKRLRDQQREMFRKFATAEVAEELLLTGFALGGKHVDATVMLERPKLAPHPAAIMVRVEGARHVRLTGALLWTHFGVSGPVVLNASRHWARAVLDKRRADLDHIALGAEQVRDAAA